MRNGGIDLPGTNNRRYCACLRHRGSLTVMAEGKDDAPRSLCSSHRSSAVTSGGTAWDTDAMQTRLRRGNSTAALAHSHAAGTSPPKRPPSRAWSGPHRAGSLHETCPTYPSGNAEEGATKRRLVSSHFAWIHLGMGSWAFIFTRRLHAA